LRSKTDDNGELYQMWLSSRDNIDGIMSRREDHFDFDDSLLDDDSEGLCVLMGFYNSKHFDIKLKKASLKVKTH